MAFSDFSTNPVNYSTGDLPVQNQNDGNYRPRSRSASGSSGESGHGVTDRLLLSYTIWKLINYELNLPGIMECIFFSTCLVWPHYCHGISS